MSWWMPLTEDDKKDAARYRWLRQHARQIVSDKQWQLLPALDDDQKDFLDQMIDVELAQCR